MRPTQVFLLLGLSAQMLVAVNAGTGTFHKDLRCRGNGGDDCCTPETPCGMRDGDCDDDEDCEGKLVCGRNNCGDV